MAKSKISLGYYHTALENIWVIFKYLLILISNIIPQWQENRLCMILDHEFLSFLYLWICSNVSQFIVYGNFNRICILLFCENCINLNYVNLAYNAFQVYYILLLLCTFILSISENLIVKLQQILIYRLKTNNHNIQWNHM